MWCRWTPTGASVSLYCIDRAIYLTVVQQTMQGLQNRPLDPAHVTALVNNFTTIRRHLHHDQLCICMTLDDLEACIVFTVEYMRHRPKNVRSVDIYEDVETLRTAVTQVNRQYTRFADLPVLCWPLNRRPFPQLDAGQSRRGALIQKEGLDAGDNDVAIIDDKNRQVCVLSCAGEIGVIDRLINVAVALRLGRVYRRH